jgi:hypothetical protein
VGHAVEIAAAVAMMSWQSAPLSHFGHTAQLLESRDSGSMLTHSDQETQELK